jgi:hypothetical protein
LNAEVRGKNLPPSPLFVSFDLAPLLQHSNFSLQHCE